MNSIFNVPEPINEPILSYESGSAERAKIEQELSRMRKEQLEIRMYINGEWVQGEGERYALTVPHDHQHVLGYFHYATAPQIQEAIDSALHAKEKWERMAWYDRVAIFLKAADLLATDAYRYKMNAATMLGQSKTVHQAEIDSACELIDFFRWNAHFLTQLYNNQPFSPAFTWNRMEYRPLEGFVVAITPFNFTSIAGNLPCTPAMMGNVVLWKPADTQIYSARVIMELLIEAGLPKGVIQLVYADGPLFGQVALNSPHCAGLHFTGSTAVFKHLWKTFAQNLDVYKNFPRIVGETGGKDFVLAHSSADVRALSVALTRGAFEFQGQKCSAASRAYIPISLWNSLQELMLHDLQSLKVGSPEDFQNFMGAVIDKKAFDKITGYIEGAKQNPSCRVLFGGNYDSSKGYFIEPTVILTTDPHSKTMEEEIFGPVLTIYVYEDEQWQEVLKLVDSTSPYGLTGAVFAQDRQVIVEATEALRYAAGNFYINDKPTGAVVGQQPFGGGRASGTNDKAGAIFNLLRWVSPRSIKENFVPPHDYRYPFMY